MNKKLVFSVFSVLVLIVVIGGVLFIYNHKRQEDFGRKFNSMNDAYKKVLFATGQEQPSTALILDYMAAWKAFYIDFQDNPIKPYSKDAMWSQSLDDINAIVVYADMLVTEGKLKDSHLELEKVRQIWQEIFTRNEVTMLGFFLTDYHDTMEKAIEAAEKNDYETLTGICASMKSSLQNVKDTVVDFKDMADYGSKLAAVSDNLEDFCVAVDVKSDLKESATRLKPTFIAFYLKYG